MQREKWPDTARERKRLQYALLGTSKPSGWYGAEQGNQLLGEEAVIHIQVISIIQKQE